MPPQKAAGAVIEPDDGAHNIDQLGGTVGILANENSAIFQDVEIKAGSAGAINAANKASGAPVSSPGEVFRSTDYRALSASFDDAHRHGQDPNGGHAGPVDHEAAKPTRSWRDVLPVHPAAEAFPLLGHDELLKLAQDIEANGLKMPIVLWSERPGANCQLLDGRNRLDAMALVGILKTPADQREFLEQFGFGATIVSTNPRTNFGGDRRKGSPEGNTDPYTHVLSLNAYRRHLTGDQKREVIAKLLKLDPRKSDRQIADTIKADHKTVGAARAAMEGRGEIPHADTRKDSKGRRQPARKRTGKIKIKPEHMEAAAAAVSRDLEEQQLGNVERTADAGAPDMISAPIPTTVMSAHEIERAIAWLLTHRPSMCGFIQHGLLQFAHEVLANPELEPQLQAEWVSCAEEVIARLSGGVPSVAGATAPAPNCGGGR